jgi:hypothetical protein
MPHSARLSAGVVAARGCGSGGRPATWLRARRIQRSSALSSSTALSITTMPPRIGRSCLRAAHPARQPPRPCPARRSRCPRATARSVGCSRGNRRLNHANHMAAVTQIRQRHSGGRAYSKRNSLRENPQRSTPRPQTAHQRRYLRPPPGRRPASSPREAPGRAAGERLCCQRGGSHGWTTSKRLHPRDCCDNRTLTVA